MNSFLKIAITDLGVFDFDKRNLILNEEFLYDLLFESDMQQTQKIQIAIKTNQNLKFDTSIESQNNLQDNFVDQSNSRHQIEPNCNQNHT